MPGRTAAYAVMVDSDAMRLDHRGALRLVGDLDQHRVGRAEARIESRRGDRAAQEDRRADQQQRRGEDLDADQRIAGAAGPRVLHQLAAQRPHRLDPRRLQRGHQREEGGGGHRRDDQEHGHAPVGSGHGELEVGVAEVHRHRLRMAQ